MRTTGVTSAALTVSLILLGACLIWSVLQG
jgi:hypothetical protein